MSDYLYPVELVDTSILSPVFQKIPGISLLRPPTFPNPQESTLPFDETLELRPSARAWARLTQAIALDNDGFEVRLISNEEEMGTGLDDEWVMRLERIAPYDSVRR